MEKNKNYWNKGLPYLDGIEFYHALPFSPEMGVGDPVQPGGLCARHRSGHRAQGQGDARACRPPTFTTRA